MVKGGIAMCPFLCLCHNAVVDLGLVGIIAAVCSQPNESHSLIGDWC